MSGVDGPGVCLVCGVCGVVWCGVVFVFVSGEGGEGQVTLRSLSFGV